MGISDRGLQQFGVIPFEIRTLKKRHTEKWRTQRQRWCVKHQRIFASFINALVHFITKQWFARFITKAIRNTDATPLSLFVPSAPSCSPSLCVPFICSRLTLSLRISEAPKKRGKVYNLNPNHPMQ